MKNKTGILSDLIHLTSLGDNLYLQRELEKIKEIVDTTPNDFSLGSKLREIL